VTSETPPDATRTARRSQAQRREATREALLVAGRALFAERGVDGVSAEELVTAAGVTRGALYHHFTNKQDLFRAVYERMEVELRDELVARLGTVADPLVALVTSIGWFLDICERPEVRRIGLVEAPAVLGWQTWREIENAYALGLIVERLDAAAGAGVPLPAPARVLAPLLFASVIEAALTIATADDPAAARAAVEPALLGIAARTMGLG
jgi:AcrR family transcriptional regulator